MPYRTVTKPDQWKVLGFRLSTITLIAVSALILVPLAWPLGLVLWLTLMISGGLLLRARRHAGKKAT